MKPKQELESLTALLESLILPGAKNHLSKQSFDATYRTPLDIRLFNWLGRERSFPNQRAFVRKTDADRVREAFKLKHWHKFMEAKCRKAL